MKGGVGLYITYYIRLEYIREGWCGTLHDITIHSWRVGWEFTFHFTSHGCRSPWNVCMIVVTWCCHVRWYMQVCHAMLQNALYGCKNVAWDLCWGGSRSTKPCVFPCEVAAGSTERYLVCAAVAAAIVSLSNRFSLGVLHIWLFNVAHACVVLCVSWICGCRSHLNGCIIVVILCCHMRKYMQVCHAMLQNAL